ncbi:hypothetical protein [Pontiella desulfatans]|nr:hypothetical protein [Pontiella desulfatans]
MKAFACVATVALLGASLAQAQLTWDVVPGTVGIGDNAIAHSNGVWDATSGNWTADGGTNNVLWISGADAVFGNNESNTAVTIDIPDAGVTVGDLTLEPGGGKVSLQAINDNIGAITVNPGGATWDTGGREIEIVGLNTSNDTRVIMTPGDTLTVVGGGTFDAGERQQNANWVATGATNDIQDGVTVRGCVNNVGQFDMIKLEGGTTYIHERNSGQTYNNDWELGAGIVSFDNRFTRPYVINGVISGPGTLLVKDLGGTGQDSRLQLNQTNTFTGGIIVDSSNNLARLSISGDHQLGAVPATFDPDNIVLRNGGMMKLTTVTLNLNRGITLENGVGGVILNSAPSTIGSPITGPGSFRVGWDGDSSGNAVILTTNNTYEGETNPRRGTIQLGIENALPTTTVLSIGGSAGASVLEMNGFNQTIGGLTTTGGNTRQIENNSATSVTLTINVASSNTYDYAANFADVGDIALVKEGAGVQRLSRSGGYSKNPVSLTINGGELEQSGTAFAVPITVNSGGTLGGIGTTLSNVVVMSGGSISPGNNDGWNSVKIEGANLDLSDMIDDNAGGLQIGFGAAFDSIIVSTNASGLGGTLDMDGPTGSDLGFSDFTFTDQDGVASGVYPILVAQSIVGTLDATDLGGDVGDLGATGMLSLSNNTVWLTIDGVDTSEYGQWASTFDLPKGSDLVDTDDDGYNNFQEFAFGGDPTNDLVVGMVPVAGTLDDGSTNWLTMVYGERTNDNPGVTYTVETVDDLVFGTWTNDVTFLGYGDTVDGITPVTNAIPIDNTKDFLGVFLEKQE